MEHLEGFDIKPPKKEEAVEKKPSYQPKVKQEEVEFAETFDATISYEDKCIYMARDYNTISIPFEKIPDVLQFLAWVARERITE